MTVLNYDHRNPRAATTSVYARSSIL